MTSTLLDFSRRSELALHARVIADVQAATAARGVPTMVTGAFARDLHVYYAHGMDTIRQTEDIDLALSVSDWATFADVKQRLIDTGRFRSIRGAQQRLRHADGMPLDLVPFAGVETAERRIDWPPDGAFQMDVFGFREALAASQRVRLPEGADTLLVSLPGLALLKICAWNDRHYRTPRKDAEDLALITENYLDLGNIERLWNEFAGWTEELEFDTARAGARMLGVNIGGLLSDSGRERVAAIVAEQASIEVPGLLPQEMSPYDPERARALLAALLKGLYEG